MNLFVTHVDPVVSAGALDDVRVGKMLIESNQILSTALIGNDPGLVSLVGAGQLSKPTHKKHPVVKWVRDTDGAFAWTLRHAAGLAHEFCRRFGHSHGSSARTYYIQRLVGDPCRSRIEFADLHFCNAARNASRGLDFAHMENVVEAYRLYLIARWRDQTPCPRWTNSACPGWFPL